MNNRKKYQEGKVKLRNFAINWQLELYHKNYTIDYIVYWANYFEKYGKKYGLLKEFRENGIV